MLKLKFSPLILFIILLVVLIFSTIICKTCFFNSSNTEGFVSYQYDKDTTISQNQYLVDLPQYSSKNPVTKLYDNLFFDKLNGNLIEVDSVNYPNIAGNISIDRTGSSISNIYVNTRNNINRSYQTVVNNNGVVARDVAESLTNTVTSSFFPWSYITVTDRTDKYQLFYMPWADNTYIHIIKINNRNGTNNNNVVYGDFSQVHVMSYLFGSGSTMSNKYYSVQPRPIQTQNDDNDPNNDKYVYDDLYDEKKSVYQLSKYVRFDKSNGNLIIRGQSPENSITIYQRNKGGVGEKSTARVNNTSSRLETNNFDSFIVSDNYQYIVLYLPISTKTMIVLLKISRTNSNRFEIQKVVRFNQDGIETETGTSSTTSTSSTTTRDSRTDASSDFYRNYWLSYSDSENQCMSEDYLLKTQIVPPVCPSCPSCAYSAGTCSNCGGAGGSGTLNTNGQTVIENGNVPQNVTGTALLTSGGAVVTGTTGSDKPINNAVDQTTNTLNTTVGTAGVLGGQTLDTTADILKSTGSGASDLLKSGASGASDLLKSGASGATDLLKTTASGATDLLKSGASGATDLLKSAGTGLKEIATDNRQASGTTGAAATAGATGTGSGVMGAGVSTRGLGGIDSYSYYGALVPKGGNYMPVTSDFSAFAK
jgi:hypothetical protein